MGCHIPSTAFGRAPGGMSWEASSTRWPLLDYVEIVERAADVGTATTARRVRAQTPACPASPSSDAHSVMEIGVAYTDP